MKLASGLPGLQMMTVPQQVVDLALARTTPHVLVSCRAKRYSSNTLGLAWVATVVEHALGVVEAVDEVEADAGIADVPGQALGRAPLVEAVDGQAGHAPRERQVPAAASEPGLHVGRVLDRHAREGAPGTRHPAGSS